MKSGEFAKFIGMPYQVFCAYETGRNYPTPRDARYLAEIAGCSPVDLFPLEFWFRSKDRHPRTIIADEVLPSENLVPVSVWELDELPTDESVEDDAVRERIVRRVAVEIVRLSPPVQRALTIRFGLDERGERTLDEVAVVLGVSKNGAKYVINRALRTLRQRLRRKELIG
jgi:hypothetical protein